MSFAWVKETKPAWVGIVGSRPGQVRPGNSPNMSQPRKAVALSQSSAFSHVLLKKQLFFGLFVFFCGEGWRWLILHHVGWTPRGNTLILDGLQGKMQACGVREFRNAFGVKLLIRFLFQRDPQSFVSLSSRLRTTLQFGPCNQKQKTTRNRETSDVC